VSSILAGIWNATTPLLTLLVALAVLPEERPSRQRVAGLLVGFAGVVVVLGPWSGIGGSSLAGMLAGLGAASSLGIGFAYTRRVLAGRPESAASLAAAQVTCGALQLAVIMPFTDGMPDALGLDVALAMLELGAIGCGLGFIVNFGIIRAAGATAAATVNYIAPVFATVLGVVVLGEAVSWNQPVGAAIILSGVAVSQGLLWRRRLVSADRVRIE